MWRWLLLAAGRCPGGAAHSPCVRDGGGATCEGSTAAPQDAEDLLVLPFHAALARNAADPVIARFAMWLEDNCDVQGLQNVFLADFLHDGLQVRGLGASRAFRHGEHVVCVPNSCWFFRDNLPGHIRDLQDSCTEAGRLAVHIAEERFMGNTSKWAPYIEMLPGEDVYRSFHPAYLTGYRLDPSIDLWPAWHSIAETCRHEYRNLPGSLPLSPGDVKLAYTWYTTRGYGWAGMVPIVDLPNSGPARAINVRQEAFAQDDTHFSICLVAQEDIAMGDELLVDYGADKSTALMFFTTYGFELDPGVHELPEKARETSEYHIPGDCAGLRPHELVLSENVTNPILLNYARFAARYCSEEVIEYGNQHM